MLDNYRYPVDDKLTLKAPPAGLPANKRRRLRYTGLDELARSRTGNRDADVAKKDDDPWTGTTENSMSVSDLRGRTRYSFAGSIREVHVVGHAWLTGPVIVNTPPYRSKKHDKDARTTDFTNADPAHVFDTRDLPAFRAAFTNDAVLVVWGCEDDLAAKDLVVSAQEQERNGKPFDDELRGLRMFLAGTYAANLTKVTTPATRTPRRSCT